MVTRAAAAKRSTAPETAPDWRDPTPLELEPILAAALDAFHENGYHGTTVRDIARRVGVTVPALYYHFENKEALLMALLDRVTYDFLRRANAADADAGTDPQTRLAYVVEAIALGMTGQPKLYALEPEIRYLGPENRAQQVAVRDQVDAVLARIVTAGVDTGVFCVPDVAESVRAILGMCQWIPRWYRPDGPLSPHEVAARYADLALRLVQAPGDAPPPGGRGDPRVMSSPPGG